MQHHARSLPAAKEAAARAGAQAYSFVVTVSGCAVRGSSSRDAVSQNTQKGRHRSNLGQLGTSSWSKQYGIVWEALLSSGILCILLLSSWVALVCAIKAQLGSRYECDTMSGCHDVTQGTLPLLTKLWPTLSVGASNSSIQDSPLGFSCFEAAAVCRAYTVLRAENHCNPSPCVGASCSLKSGVLAQSA